MTDERWVLAVDLGTGGPKTALVSMRGDLAAADFEAVDTRVLSGGGAVQDPGDWWAAIRSSTRRLLDGGHVPRERLAAVACTGQWGSTVPVDEAGDPAGDCLLWWDSRGAAYSREVVGGPVRVAGFAPQKAVHWIRRSGGAPSPEGSDPLSHVLWLEREEPAVYRRTATFLEPVDYLGLRFTGEAVATPASMILSWLTDNRDLTSVAYDPDLVRLSTRDPGRLPPLRPTSSVVGPVLPEVADELGLPAGVPVVAGTPDLHSAAVAAGTLGDFEPHLAISSSSWLSCHVPFKRTSILRQMTTVPGVVPGRYLLANNHETAGAALRWLRDNVMLHDDGLTEPGWADSGYAAFDEVARRVSAGSNGVIFTPWLNGERCPVDDGTIRAGFHNLSLRTTREDMVRALFEGVAFNARWMLEAGQRVLRRRLGDIRFLGGGAASDVWCQIHADVLDRRVVRVADPFYANVRGAALFAGLVLGELDQREVAGLVSVDAVFEPDPAHRKVYDELYREFPRLYRRLRRVHARLNRR